MCFIFTTLKGFFIASLVFYIFNILIFDKFLISEQQKLSLTKLEILQRKYVRGYFSGLIWLSVLWVIDQLLLIYTVTPWLGQY